MLFRSKKLRADSLHWIEGYAPTSIDNITAKIRYRQKDQECSIVNCDDDVCDVEFVKPQFAITPGQSVVFYYGDMCLGGGIITNRF